MVRLTAIRELFAHNDWAFGKLLGRAAELTDAQLDHPFEMGEGSENGEGSLRVTLNHLWAAERVWLDRWQKRDQPRYRPDASGVSAAQLRDEFHTVATERAELLASVSDGDLARPLPYRNTKGDAYAEPLGDLMLHVCNHGTHHRAQALNMLKRLGGDPIKPGLDYIYFKLEQPGGGTTGAAPTPVDVESVRAYYRYADWARDRVQDAAAKLDDAALDREFPIGIGTLRKTLLHIRFAEQWWLENWKHGPGRPFPELDDTTSIAELLRLFDGTARERNELLSGLDDAGLSKTVEAIPRPGVHRAFPLGVTMLQLCCHGTHHRAQALNMLRHVGGDVPWLDVVTMLRA